jgi:hypothetical protein
VLSIRNFGLLWPVSASLKTAEEEPINVQRINLPPSLQIGQSNGTLYRRARRSVEIWKQVGGVCGAAVGGRLAPEVLAALS